MKITVLGVGSEAQYQATFDTAYQYIKKETAPLAAELSYSICRPEAAGLFAALRESMAQSEAVLLLLPPEPAAVSTALRVVSGGLERTVSTDAALQKQLEQRAARLGLRLPYEQLSDFASFPSGATLLPNPQGMVQGYAISARRQLLLALPALPGELSALYTAEVRPLLGKLTGAAVSYGMVRVLELDQFSVRQEVDRLNQNPHLQVSSRHRSGDYEIYLEATGADQTEADSYLQKAIAHMQQTFGIYLYCIGNRELPQIVTDGLAQHSLSLSTAEWGTGGLFRQQLSAVYGSAGCYRAAYDDTHIGRELELPRRLLQQPEENAAAIAGHLAAQSRRAGHTNLGLGIFCPPEGGQLYVALADKSRVWNRRLAVPPARQADTAQIAVWQAMNVLRLYTAQYPRQLPGGTELSGLEKHAGRSSLFSRKGAESQNPKGRAALSNPEGKEQDRKMNKKRQSGEGTANAAPAAEALKGTNLIQRIKMKALTKNDKIRLIALGVCLIVFLASLIYIVNNKLQSVNNGKLSEELSGLYDPDATTGLKVEGYPEDYIPGFEALYLRNPDIAGWVKIPDTKLDYAVMQAEDNDKYHRTDIDLKPNDWGIPYVDFRVDQQKPSFNTVIYGHNMGDGTMFGYLTNYKKLSYYQQHPLISYNSVYRKEYSSGTIKWVEFTAPSTLTSAGTIYYDYGRSDQKSFTRSTLNSAKFYYGTSSSYGDYALDDLSFVASSSFNAAVELSFRAYYSESKYVDGTVVLQPDGTAASSNYIGNIRYSTTTGTKVQINANDISRFFSKVCPGYTMQYVMLTGVPSTGSLYYNYYGTSKYGTTAKAQITASNCGGQAFYASPTSTSQFALTELTYVPSGSNYCASIPFTACSGSRSVSGAILISVSNSTVAEVYGATPKNTAVTFPASSIYNAVLNATGSALSSIQLLSLPSYTTGTVYVGTGTSTAANTTTQYTYGGTMNQLRFVPATGYTGSVEIPYVALNSNGTAIASGTFSLGVVNSVKKFSDVTTSTWCYKYVAELSDASVIAGYNDGTFKPNSTVTYGAALKLIMLAAGYPEQKPVNSNVFSGYLAKARAEGIITRINVDLTKPITRLQVAQLAAGALKLNTSNLSSVKPFTDTNDASVQALNAAGIVEGYFSNGTSTYKPNNTLTRGQVSAIVWRMQNYRK